MAGVGLAGVDGRTDAGAGLSDVGVGLDWGGAEDGGGGGGGGDEPPSSDCMV